MRKNARLIVAFGLLALSMMVLGSFQVENTASSSVRGTDSIVGTDARNTYGATDYATTLYAPASGIGNIYYSTDQYDQYKVPVTAGEQVRIQISRASGAGSFSGLDVPVYNTNKAAFFTRSNIGYGGFDETVTASGNGYIYFTLDGDNTNDRGNYNLAVSKIGGSVEDGGLLTDGVAAAGHMDAADGSDMYWIDVGANAESMRVVLAQSSGDFDTYGRFGAQPTTSTYDWRGYTSGGEDNTVTSPGNGRHYIMVDYYSGDADYTLTATVTYAAADTTAPSVSISAPSNGATVSGTVTISFSASDANGISSRAIKIDGVTKSTSSSYSWNTASYSDGTHTIQCTATDPSGNTGSDTHSVTVDNAPVADDGGALTDGVGANGNMDSADGADMYWIDVGPNADSMYVTLTCGSADFDTYGRFGAQPTTSTYDWRGYTSGGEENTVTNPSEGRHYIMVDYYSGSGPYTLTATITYGGGGGGSWGTGGKYAIIVGISDYQSISDLSYCDEDATDIYNFLNGQGYECHVYGDKHTSNYPRYDGDAYESTVRAAIQELAAHAQSGDTVIFTTSGHGAGDGNGNSYLCMYECSGSAGCYYDYELQSDFSGFATGVDIMVFVDHCYSGGLGPELLASHGTIYITTTCTEDGYGWDDPTHQNGAWTYEYFEKYWVGNPTWSAEYVYDQASASYPHSGGDACMEFDGFSGSFYI
jgi:hypothetical protein